MSSPCNATSASEAQMLHGGLPAASHPSTATNAPTPTAAAASTTTTHPNSLTPAHTPSQPANPTPTAAQPLSNPHPHLASNPHSVPAPKPAPQPASLYDISLTIPRNNSAAKAATAGSSGLGASAHARSAQQLGLGSKGAPKVKAVGPVTTGAAGGGGGQHPHAYIAMGAPSRSVLNKQCKHEWCA